MAVVTPTTITQTNLGSHTTYVLELPATADEADTVETGLSNIRWVIASQQDTAGTATSQGVGASWVTSTGVITLHIGEDNAQMVLLVICG